MSEGSLIGSVLADRYRVDALIGEGAMGRVYRAEHVLMRKRVAIKILHRELTQVPEIVQRFEREARAAANIDHPHVASATDFGKLPDGSVYLVLEYVEGKSLSELVEDGPQPVARVLGIALQISAALEAAHRAGIVHRDLKPDNVLLVSKEDESDWVKVLDFGIAKVPAEQATEGKPITQVGMVFGTPEYMAPEQALGQAVDARADLYSLGVLMYEMLCGQRPYSGPAVGLLGQQLSRPLPALADRGPVRVPAAVEQFVRRLLAPDVNQRCTSAVEVSAALEELLASPPSAPSSQRPLLSSSIEEVTGRFAEATHRAARTPRGRGVLLALVFGGLGVAIAVVAAAWLARESADPGAANATPIEVDVPEPAETRPVGLRLERIDQAEEQGLQALEKLAEEFPSEGEVHAALALGYAKGGQYQDAVDEARVALALDPKLNDSPKVAGALFRAAQSTTATASAFRLLEGAMGTAGADIVYDLRHTPGIKPWVKVQSTEFLQSEEIRSVASPALLLLLDLSEVEDCETAERLVAQAAVDADKRALPLLEQFQQKDGCGPRKAEDCYPCLRDDDKLEQTIAQIRRRSTLDEPESDANGAETAGEP